ncbi:MAG: tRNA (adenosine(37)-N6)-threonylcarbamoyltransferase complex transferase subunit TsaD [Oscillospiraceae bacterium]
MKILAIESSCDETAVAVVEDGTKVHSNIIATQIAEHRLYGGVVPEIASRRHCENIVGVTDEALKAADMTLDDIDAIAVTYAPGLIGALLVGVNFAKGLSLSTGKPLIPVHHIRSHIAANYLEYPDLKPPFLCLVVSGGHTHIIEVKGYTEFKVIGRTRDDAAGETYDKAARAMGYPYPGGIEIDKASVLGNPLAYKLPRPRVDGSEYDMSFSGLKTSVLNLLHNSEQKGIELNKIDLCASFQLAVCDILSDKLMLAAKNFGYTNIVVAGGVSANSGIRKRLADECQKRDYKLYIPPLKYCGDNAAMVGSQAYYEYLSGNTASLDLNAISSLPIG